MRIMRIVGLLVLVFGAVDDVVVGEVGPVSLGVDGLSCPFCALSLEKKLKRVPGVASVAVHLKKARADLILSPGSPLDATSIRWAVEDAGFTLRGIHVEVAGTVERDDTGSFVLTSRGDATRFLLLGDARGGPPVPLTPGTGIASRLATAEREGSWVRIRGTIRRDGGTSLGLLVQAIDTAEEGE